MKKTIHEYLNDLERNSPPEVRQEAVRQLQEIDEKDLPLLVQPMGKEYWDSAAEVITTVKSSTATSIMNCTVQTRARILKVLWRRTRDSRAIAAGSRNIEIFSMNLRTRATKSSAVNVKRK